MSEHGGPAGADGVEDGRGHEIHGIPGVKDAWTAAAVDWRPRKNLGDPRGAVLEAGQGEHLSKDTLWRFMTGGLSSVEMRSVFGHLLRGCASCREQAREVWNITVPTAASSAAAPCRESANAAADARAVPVSPPTPETLETPETPAIPATPAIDAL
ncbi:MAG TPA: hypothetical protein VN970_07130, partial [Thermoanaerobaculia bacterium]|nr:hypothetical protein [Thermoanaerobaculia bacterium]